MKQIIVSIDEYDNTEKIIGYILHRGYKLSSDYGFNECDKDLSRVPAREIDKYAVILPTKVYKDVMHSPYYYRNGIYMAELSIVLFVQFMKYFNKYDVLSKTYYNLWNVHDKWCMNNLNEQETKKYFCVVQQCLSEPPNEILPYVYDTEKKYIVESKVKCKNAK